MKGHWALWVCSFLYYKPSGIADHIVVIALIFGQTEAFLVSFRFGVCSGVLSLSKGGRDEP